MGAQFAQRSGGYSLATDILQTPEITKKHRERLQQKLKAIYESDDLSPAEKDRRVIETTMSASETLRDELIKHLSDVESPAALMVNSGAKGNKFALSAGMGFDGLYTGTSNNPIPFPVLHNYSEGLNPFEYFAGTFGARRGVVDVKMSVAQGGWVGKQIAQVMHKGVISADDYPEGKYRPGIGLPSETGDSDNIGRLLAQDVGGYKRNTLITDAVLKDLQNKKITDILVRSPMVGGPADGSLYSKDVGMGDKSRFWVTGENPGMIAGQAISEPITQSILSSKHTGGVAGATAAGVGGFKKINQMLQVPSIWEGAVHSLQDGKVTSVETDELGNQIVTVGGDKHVIPHTNSVTVKTGDMVEEGDVLSDGLPNPAEIVLAKGIGEGRRYFVNTFNNVLQSAGIKTTERNIELIAKGLIDHIQIDEEHDGYLPSDTVSYSKYESDYAPREDASKGKPEYFADYYLEEPALHYTIGTKLRPSVLANLKKYGVKSVTAHKSPPRFTANLVRAMASTSVSDDWLTRMGGSYQKRSILEAAQKGMTADPFGPSFYSAMVGRTEFNKAKPGQPDPIIKSILPNIPQKQITPPSLDPEAPDWFNVDG
jgi:DNA-directed RNA polymerase subunit beta'